MTTQVKRTECAAKSGINWQTVRGEEECFNTCESGWHRILQLVDDGIPVWQQRVLFFFELFFFFEIKGMVRNCILHFIVNWSHFCVEATGPPPSMRLLHLLVRSFR